MMMLYEGSAVVKLFGCQSFTNEESAFDLSYRNRSTGTISCLVGSRGKRPDDVNLQRTRVTIRSL